ncbi:hypothetical protein [Burkholderia stabilis]|uniref:hypothetical protein n=1 Tax=Burkholderia stabilis TaxID=95485 RepID=UPI00158FB5C9|nr:hypothetical protein [Burkholderia stabilis]
MSALDAFDVWFISMKVFFDKFHVNVKFIRPSADDVNPYCSINLRRDNSEIDLLVWESGEAELVTGDAGGVVDQVHFNDVNNKDDILGIFLKMNSFITAEVDGRK